MHQRITTDPLRLLKMYERGLLTLVATANDLIEATASPPTAELMAKCPAEVLDRIRELAAMPPDTEWLVCEPVHREPGYDPEVERIDHELWLAGLAFWRAYIGIAAES